MTALATTLRTRRWAWGILVPLIGIGLLQLMFRAADHFPAAWDSLVQSPVDDFNSWARSHRTTHWLFTGLFTPLSRSIEWSLSTVEDFLLWLPWYVIVLAVVLVIARSRAWVAAGVATAAMIYPGLVGLWDVTMATLALMAIAVLIALVIGIPLGVLAALKPRVERVVRPVLDAMQTVPAPVYFIPVVLFFGIRRVPATVATVIYALPPAVRLTTLGIRQVPEQAIEAARVFGSTRGQILRKVQLPMALPTIMTGVNQTIMMALGIVVLASLLGAGGLGQEVLDALQLRSTGRGLAAGLAIVAVAMVLDRVSRSLVDVDPTRKSSRKLLFGAPAALAVLAVVGAGAGGSRFPKVWNVASFAPIDDAVLWVRDTLYPVTRPINDFIVAQMLIPVRDFLMSTLAWPTLLALAVWLAWRSKGWTLALLTGVGLGFIGLIGMWELSIQTLTQVMAGVIISVLIAVPIGVWAGRNQRIEAALSPLLDALQTIPSFVYIIPVVMLFTVGQVPGIIASVLYAIVPGIRITALGIRQVPVETLEASRTFGATGRQTLFGVRIPMAAPTIMAAINQIIMMVLAMVIIAGMVGGGALGFEAVRSLQRSLVGLGFEVGIAIVIMAIVLDRITQAWAERLRPPAAALE